MANNNTNWRLYENLIFNIYKEIEPFADVTLNDHILGLESGALREIDISIKNKIAGHSILIIVQAKNLKKRADIKVLGEFNSVIEDVRASKGILICNSGFTTTAKEYAQRRKIDICTAHDASNKKWEAEISIPVIKTSIKVNIKIQHTFIPKYPVSIDGIEMPFPEIVITEFLKKWETSQLDKKPGTHYIEFDRDLIASPNSYMALKTGVEYVVQHRHHFKSFKPIDYRGIKNYITENFTPSFIEFKEAIPYLNDGTWDYVSDITDIALETSHLKIEIIDFDLLKRKMIRINWDKK